jgi:hypothetical protein
MILSIKEVVSYTSIICMILVYDTPHYNQPNQDTAMHTTIHIKRRGGVEPIRTTTQSKQKTKASTVLDSTRTTRMVFRKQLLQEVNNAQVPHNH